MKKSLLTLAIAFTAVLTHAQAPSTFSYQAVVRDASNELVISSTVGTRISILQTTSTGIAVYVETHLPTTNANGLISLQIGDGAVVSGTFASIDWSNGPYFIKTETDPTGGTTYSIAGTQQLLSVPYALYAETSGTGGPQGPTGAPGAPGANGVDGTNGVDGATGATGPSGEDGTNGVDGATGDTGPQGATGDTGPQGLTGNAGADGSTGLKGDTGLQGLTGNTGADESDGMTILNGV